MFTKLELKNYKGLIDASWNLSKTKSNGDYKSIVALYGKNGAGKTTLLEPLMKLPVLLRTFTSQRSLMELQKKLTDNDETMNGQDVEKIINRLQHIRSTKIIDILKNSATFNSKGLSSITYSFLIKKEHSKNITGKYTLEFDKNGNLVQETFFSLVKQRNGKIFAIKKVNNEILVEFSRSAIVDGGFKKELISRLKQFWGVHTFFSILNGMESTAVNDTTFKGSLSDSIYTFYRNLEGISFAKDARQGVAFNSQILANPISGEITKENSHKLNLVQQYIQEYLISIDSDIKKAYYQFDEMSDDKLKYNLYISKNIWGEEKNFPFKYESNGIRKMLRLFPLIILAMNGQTVIYDEIDNGVHDLILGQIFSQIGDYMDGQLIFSTHNTTLLQTFSPSNAYLIDEKKDGTKTIKSVDEIKEIKKGHNIQKLYLSGKLGGTPQTIDKDKLLNAFKGISKLVKDF
ncbi:AAA family ATPase [Ligilactobacillus equi]|nr:AAA family ATPase [Ligilactobacillus equi]